MKIIARCQRVGLRVGTKASTFTFTHYDANIKQSCWKDGQYECLNC